MEIDAVGNIDFLFQIGISLFFPQWECACAVLKVNAGTMSHFVDERGLLRLKLPNGLSPHRTISQIINSICCFCYIFSHEGRHSLCWQ